MQRVVVLGIPGAGKSTFARRLGEILDLPVDHLDRYFWNPGWKPTPPEEWQARQKELISGDTWIIDGDYKNTISLRLERADTAIFLDMTRWLALWRVIKRIITYRNNTRPDMGDGCPERWFDRAFMRYIWRYHQDVRPRTLALLEEFAARPGRQVIHLSSNRQTEEWLARIQAERRGRAAVATDYSAAERRGRRNYRR